MKVSHTHTLAVSFVGAALADDEEMGERLMRGMILAAGEGTRLRPLT
ncbi:MAG: hypothetical protein SLRJCFUN_001903, partial [Candidatus Fervidibacter sp.]